MRRQHGFKLPYRPMSLFVLTREIGIPFRNIQRISWKGEMIITVSNGKERLAYYEKGGAMCSQSHKLRQCVLELIRPSPEYLRYHSAEYLPVAYF